MGSWLNRLKQQLGKPLLFGIYGAIGCLLAAVLLGEMWLALTRLPPTPATATTHAIVLLIDTSDSMSGSNLSEAQAAATRFVDRQDLTRNQLAIVNFGAQIQVVAPLNSQANTLKQAISRLSANGATPMQEGIQTASQVFQSSLLRPEIRRDILLFTDGQPSNPFKTLIEAVSARNQGINIVAVATAGADTQYLAQVTGNPALVFYANAGDFDRAFQAAEKAIFNPQLAESHATGTYDLGYSALRMGGWAGLLALGIALALVAGQNHYLKRRLLTWKSGSVSVILGLLTGLVAGGIGQLLFAPLGTMASDMALLATLGRVVGWTILGALMGLGMSIFVPNLKPRRALVGGAIGGLLGAWGFLGAAAGLGDLIGRLCGAAILGFFIGLMIALMEQLSRSAWLVVHWGKSEQTQISLGSQPILLGSSAEAHVPLSRHQGYPPITAKIFTEGSRIVLQFDAAYAQQRNMKILRQELEDGAKRKLGNIEIEIKTATAIPPGQGAKQGQKLPNQQNLPPDRRLRK